MEIRVYNKMESKVIFNSSNIDEAYYLISAMGDEQLEIQLVYTTSLIRRVDVETFLNSCKYIVAFIKTEYYSGQNDGSFTTTDSKEFEKLLPHLATIEDLSDEDINLKLKEVLDKRLSLRLISCNHIILSNPFAMIDGLLYSKEVSDMNRVYAPQNDYSEYLLSHIVAVDKETKSIKYIDNEDELFSLIFSEHMLSEFDRETLGFSIDG